MTVVLKNLCTILSGEYKWSDILSKYGFYIHARSLSVGRRQTIGGCLLGRCRHKEGRGGFVSWINRSSHSKASLSRDQNLFPKILPLPCRPHGCSLPPGTELHSMAVLQIVKRFLRFYLIKSTNNYQRNYQISFKYYVYNHISLSQLSDDRILTP